jgi:hypothetical protein
MSATKTNKVLVTGASGLLGVAAIEKFFPRAGRSSEYRVASRSYQAAATSSFCRSTSAPSKRAALPSSG